MGLVRSVNVGLPRPAAWTTIGRTSIDKAPVIGPVEVGRLGLYGDQVSNRRHHGRPDKAVYAFAREDLGRNGLAETGWLRRFTADARPGPYLRVVAPGHLEAGEAIEVVRRPGHGVTVAMLFRALHGEPGLWPTVLPAGDDLPVEARARAAQWTARP